MSKPSYQELLTISISLAMKICERNTEIARLREENAKLLEENDQLIDDLADYIFMEDVNQTIAEIMHKSQIDWVEEYLVDQYANAMEERCQ
jgi:hypothetical protein